MAGHRRDRGSPRRGGSLVPAGGWYTSEDRAAEQVDDERGAALRFSDADEPAFSERWALFLDVDGTLLHLAEHPDDVEARPEVLAILASLHRLTGGAIALVSGRSLEALDEIFAPLIFAAAGQHGHERRDAAGAVHRDDYDARGVETARSTLTRFAAAHPGTHLEDKGASVALHYRGAAGAEQAVRELASRLADELPDTLRLQPGKMVLEIKPRGGSKDYAIAELMSEPPFAGRTPVFLGDDATDEDGFRWVNAKGGLSIKVGPGETAARHRLDDVDAVVGWLRAYRDFLSRKREEDDRA